MAAELLNGQAGKSPRAMSRCRDRVPGEEAAIRCFVFGQPALVYFRDGGRRLCRTKRPKRGSRTYPAAQSGLRERAGWHNRRPGNLYNVSETAVAPRPGIRDTSDFRCPCRPLSRGMSSQPTQPASVTDPAASVDVEAFLDRGEKSDGSKLANFQPFAKELCKPFRLPEPERSRRDVQANNHVFEHRVDFKHDDGTERSPLRASLRQDESRRYRTPWRSPILRTLRPGLRLCWIIRAFSSSYYSRRSGSGSEPPEPSLTLPSSPTSPLACPESAPPGTSKASIL